MIAQKRSVAFVAVVVVIVAAFLILRPRYLIQTRSGTAVLHASGLLSACEAYRMHPAAKGKFPATLADLVTPPFGGTGYLKYGPQDLIDPWGNPYRYAVVPDDRGEPVAYV